MIRVNWARLAARASAFSMGVWIVGGTPAHSQGRGGKPPLSPKASAPIDLTGYWVSLVTEDWRYRMVTPPKGDYESVPLNQQGQKVADAWDPAKDKASGNQCKAYGAAGVMRIPGRLHITWPPGLPPTTTLATVESPAPGQPMVCRGRVQQSQAAA